MNRTELLDDVQPRPEARPLTWSQLTEDQRQAARRACSLLQKMMAGKSRRPSKERSGVEIFLPPIDRERVNHVVLLDGGRGSGKTALLVTLLHVLNQRVRRKDVAKKDDARLHEELGPILGPPGRIVPVGLVDLQPLPRSTNLLLYIVGRFQRVVEAIEQATGREGGRAPWHAAGEDEPKCRTQWNHFLRAAAMGWDHGLGGRRAQLDPEAYVLEVDQAERQRLDVVSSFGRFVDALVEEYGCFWPGPRQAEQPRSAKAPRPFFIVAIDDADMNPARSVELLDLVRALWHPRVAFLLTGHSDLFLHALQAHVLGTLHEPLRGLSSIDRETSASFDPRAHGRLAVDIYDKAIPRGHRCTLKELKLEERYSVVKVALEERFASEHAAQLAVVMQLLDRYELLRAALPARFRELIDFQQSIPSLLLHPPEGGDDALRSELLQRMWKVAIDDPGLAPLLGERLQSWLRKDQRGRISLRPDGNLTFRLSSERQVSRKIGEAETMTFGAGLEFEARLDTEPLPAAVAGCLQVFSDFALASAVSWDESDLWAVEVHVGTDHKVAWRLPKWARYSGYLDFMARWSSAVDALEGQPDTAALARRYLCSVLSEDGSPTWEYLAQRVARLAADPSVEGALRSWARTDAGLLAAPEAGLPPDEANSWLEALRMELEKQKQWASVRTELAGARRSRLVGLHRNVGVIEDRALQEFNRRWPAYTWYGVVERDAEKLMAMLVKRMFSITAPTQHRENLEYYLSQRRRAALAALPPELLDRFQQDLRLFAEQSGTLSALAIEALWRIVTESERNASLRRLLQRRGDRIDVAIEEVIAELGRPLLESGPAGGILLDMQRGDVLGLILAPARIAWTKENTVDPAIYPILEMAWDIATDAPDARGPDLQPWWTVAGGDMARFRPIPWPAAPWPTLIEWERIIERWNTEVFPRVRDLVHQAQDARRAGAGDINFDIYGDAAAYWFMSATAHFADHGCDLSHVSLFVGTGGERWSTMVASMYQERSRVQQEPSARKKAYLSWIERVGLFAAPESGLSEVAAEGILAGIPDLPERRKKLADQRKERLRFIKVREEYVESTVSHWNETCPNHPWTVQIEVPLRAASAPPTPSEPPPS